MGRLAPFALVPVAFAMFVLPACAQRGASHGGGGGGFSAHGAPSFHSSFSNSAPRSFSSGPHYAAAGSRYTIGRQPSQGYRGYAPRASAVRPAFYSHANNYRRRSPNPGYPGYPGYRAGSAYAGTGVWLSPYELGYPSTIGYDNAAPYADAGPQDPGALYPDQQVPAGRYPDQQAYAAPESQIAVAPLAPAAALEPEDAVTLIYKDGRSEQIHNYALTRTTLYITGKHHRDIPLDQLDLAATEKVNHDAGVAFALPQAN